MCRPSDATQLLWFTFSIFSLPLLLSSHALFIDVGISKGGTCIVKLPAPAAGTSGTGAAAGAHAVAGVGVLVGHNKAADPTQAAAPAARVTSPSTRACPACTFINPSTATSCAMCTGPLAGAEAGAGAGAGGGGGGGGGGAGNRARAGGTGGDWKFEVKKMPDDNSCLFHAVGFLLGDGTLSASQLRGKIVDAVKASPDRWSAATLGKPIDEYADLNQFLGRICSRTPMGSLGTAACDLPVMLTRALLMTSSNSEGTVLSYSTQFVGVVRWSWRSLPSFSKQRSV